MRLKNLHLKNAVLSYQNTEIAFDKEGVSEDTPSALAKGLLTLPYYSAVEDGEDGTEDMATEQEKTPTGEKEQPQGESKEEATSEKKDYAILTMPELKKRLDEQHIKYPKNANKQDLIKLLER